MIAAGTFREDLYYRINPMTLNLPPLSERVEDIPLIVRDVLNRMGGEGVRCTESAMNALAPTCSVHQLDEATMAMPITPTRYTYHGAPANRSVCRFASRYASSSTSAIACTKKQMPNRLK